MSTQTTEKTIKKSELTIPIVTLTIDDIALTVPKGTTIYTAAKMLGIDIPIFCYHDRMPPFGACRMCLVEVEKMSKLQASCTLEVFDGMAVKTQSARAVKEREEILELLLINHPLDCPICDRGGECPLQDHALKHGPGESRFFEEKRHFEKPIALGPVLTLDRERCITCARCTRFGEIVAGDHALEFIDRGYRTEVGTPGGGPVQSKFIGNTISICPVGALTSTVYRFRARPWDNDAAPSTCTLCPVGCSLFIDSRDGEVMRMREREDRHVNDVWLCDKGWFGYEFTDSPDRLKTPLVRRGDRLESASWEEALNIVATKIKEAKPEGKLAALGGNPLTVEENFLFQKLMREVVGVNHVDHRVGTPIFNLDEEMVAPGMEISIGECEKLDFAVLFGVDLTEEFPVIWLRLKQAVNQGAKILFFGHFAPETAADLEQIVLHFPGNELEILRQHLPHLTNLACTKKNGALFVGSQYLANPQRKAILQELLNLQKAAPQLTLNVLEGRGNSRGARFAGMHPEVGPLNKPIHQPGLNANEIVKQNSWDLLYVAGADLANKLSLQAWTELRSKLKFLVVQDLFLTKTAEHADVVLPALSFVEKEGSFINIAGCIQKLKPGKSIPEGIYSDGDIFKRLAERLGTALEADSLLMRELQEERIPPALPRTTEEPIKKPTPKEAKLHASFAPVLFDRGVRMKHNPHVIKLAKEPHARLHPVEAIKREIKNGDEIVVAMNGSEITATVKVDERIALGTVVLPIGFEELPVYELSELLLNGMPVEIHK